MFRIKLKEIKPKYLEQLAKQYQIKAVNPKEHLQLLNNIPAAACNVKFVYDSSDYVTYLKQKAVNKNYNDLTYGGDQSKSSQSAIRAIRRY